MRAEQSDDDREDAHFRDAVARRQSLYSAEALRRGAAVDEAIAMHPQFLAGLNAIDRAFQLGRALSTPTGVCIVGPAGVGKSTLLEYFLASLPPNDLFEAGRGAIRIRMPKSPILGSTIEAILSALRYPFPKTSNAQIAIKRQNSLDALRQYRTHVLLVDEAHNLCRPTTSKGACGDEGTPVTEYLRQIVDHRVGLVLCGGAGLLQLQDRDKYLHSRCASAVEFKRFDYDRDWMSVISQLVSQCPEHGMATLLSHANSDRLQRATCGSLRWLKMLVIEAVLISTDKGRSELADDDLRAAFDQALAGLQGLANPWSDK